MVIFLKAILIPFSLQSNRMKLLYCLLCQKSRQDNCLPIEGYLSHIQCMFLPSRLQTSLLLPTDITPTLLLAVLLKI